MGVDHRGGDISMTQQLLHRAEIVPLLDQVGGEGVACGSPLSFEFQRRLMPVSLPSASHSHECDDGAFYRFLGPPKYGLTGTGIASATPWGHLGIFVPMHRAETLRRVHPVYP